MVLIYMFVPMGNTALLFVGLPLNVMMLMKFPPMGPFMTELYPTSVRGNAQGFCYNAGRAIGAVFPTLIGVLSETMPLGLAMALFSVMAFGLMIVTLLMLPETLGRGLDKLETAADAPEPAPSRLGPEETFPG
jgi:sugar phosphate permease